MSFDIKYESIKHYKFPTPESFDLKFIHDNTLTSTVCTIQESVMAKIVNFHDKICVDAVIDYAKDNGVGHLYIMDEKFVLDALKEKLIRDGYVGGDNNDVTTDTGDA